MITGIGDNCIDRYLAPIQAEFVGGNVANVVANIALRGGRTAYVGSVGADAAGTRIANTLLEIGVDLGWLQRVPEGSTGITELELAGGDARIVAERYGVSASVNLDAHTLDEIAAGSSWVHTSRTGDAGRYADALRARGVGLSIDLGVVRDLRTAEALAPLAAKFEVVFFSAGAQLADAQVEALARALRARGTTVIGTRGAAGCLAVEDRGRHAQPAANDNRPVIDALGAGDAFIAGFLATAGSTLQTRLRAGSHWAASACRIYGSWPQGVSVRMAAQAAAERGA